MNSFAPELEAARMARPPVKDDDASAGPPPEPAPTSSPAPGPRPEWLEETVLAGRAAARWLGQPRPRTALVGVALLLIGAVIAAGSVWTLPLVIVGVAMIVVAWIGRRLGGHVGVTWGEHGAEIAVQARIQPAAEQDAPARPAIAQEAPAPETRPEAEDVIEGEAHTVEIDVEELRALIAAAEAADRPQTPTIHALGARRPRRAAG
jgi:hypothetical protein